MPLSAEKVRIGNMTIWRVQVVTTSSGNRSAAVRGDKLSITLIMAVWGRWCIHEPLKGTWLIRLRHWGDEWVCEQVSIWHDKALMRWQIKGSFSYSSHVIVPSFQFSHIRLLLRNSLRAGLLLSLRCLHCFNLCELSLVPDSVFWCISSFASSSHFFSIVAFSLLLCSAWISIATAWQENQLGEGVNIPQNKKKREKKNNTEDIYINRRSLQSWPVMIINLEDI